MKNILLIITTVCLALSSNAQPWYEIQTGTTKKLHAIDFPSSEVGYIVGDSSLLLKSIDGGETWSEVTIIGIVWSPTIAIVDVDFVSETTGYISTEFGGPFKTVDGGVNWTHFSNPASSLCYAQTIYIDNMDHFFLGGAGCFQGAMIEEYNAGVWTSVQSDPIFWNADEHVQEISFGDANVGIAAVRNNYIFRTDDGGANWDTVRIDLSVVGYLTSVKMVDNLLAYAGYNENGGGFGILKTIDGGLTWAQDGNSGTFYYPSFNCVHVADNGDVYSGATPSFGQDGLIFESTDGVNWLFESVDQPINGMASYEDDITFAVGDSGYLVVNTLPASLAINDFSYDALSIYPNPAQDELFVRWNDGGEEDIQVFNSTGAKVQVTIDKIGDLTKLDVSLLADGLYILKICESDQLRSVKFVKN